LFSLRHAFLRLYFPAVVLVAVVLTFLNVGQLPVSGEVVVTVTVTRTVYVGEITRTVVVTQPVVVYLDRTIYTTVTQMLTTPTTIISLVTTRLTQIVSISTTVTEVTMPTLRIGPLGLNYDDIIWGFIPAVSLAAFVGGSILGLSYDKIYSKRPASQKPEIVLVCENLKSYDKIYKKIVRFITRRKP